MFISSNWSQLSHSFSFCYSFLFRTIYSYVLQRWVNIYFVDIIKVVSRTLDCLSFSLGFLSSLLFSITNGLFLNYNFSVFFFALRNISVIKFQIVGINSPKWVFIYEGVGMLRRWWERKKFLCFHHSHNRVWNILSYSHFRASIIISAVTTPKQFSNFASKKL